MGVLKIFAAFAAGVGCGILLTRSYFEKQYKELADEEIESVVETFKIKIDDNKNEEGSEKVSKADKKMYNKIVMNYDTSADIHKVLAENEHPQDDIPEEPFQITSMEFFNEDEFDKESVTYYIPDEVLVGRGDENEEDILEINATIGADSIELLENGFDDGSAMYVRNPRIGVDYEVSKTYSSFKDMMLNG